jgi:hypothetical protein
MEVERVTQQPAAPRIAVAGIVISLIMAVEVAVLRSANADPVERSASIATAARSLGAALDAKVRISPLLWPDR